MKPKVALIGCGYWGSKIKKYIPEYFDLKYVANSKFDREIIWKDKEITGVIIATPVETHYELGKEALLNGRHIFIEKPITLKTSEAKELRQIARVKKLEIGVDYVHTFSSSLKTAVSLNSHFNDLKYMEMSTKHLGRFMKLSVYWLLASHHLSILDMFMDLADLSFTNQHHMYNPIGDGWQNKYSSGTIYFENNRKGFHGKIDVSLDYFEKEMLINFYGRNYMMKYNALDKNSLKFITYDQIEGALPDDLITKKEIFSFDESNNLELAMSYFRNLMDGREESNIDRSIKVTKVLEGLNDQDRYRYSDLQSSEVTGKID